MLKYVRGKNLYSNASSDKRNYKGPETTIVVTVEEIFQSISSPFD